MSKVAAEVGSTANNYQILAKLATGGMAEIFLARGEGVAGVERHCVLKRILRDRAQDAELVRMFLDEARLAAQLQHPNIAAVYDIGKLGDSYFFTMEYVHGETVRALLGRAGGLRRPVPLAVALTITAGVAAGLHHAHERNGIDGRPLGIVHRDVSPSNLMVAYEGNVKLMDFGVAKAADRAVETRSGTVKGKISYLSPEQCRGIRIDRRSDLFSLGIVLWEMLTAERLYRRASDFDNMSAIVNETPPPPSSRRREVPPELDALVLKLLAKKADARFATANEVVEAIEDASVRAGTMVSASAVARFVRDIFGTRPEPWLEADTRTVPHEPVTVTSQPLPKELAAQIEADLASVMELSSPSSLVELDDNDEPIAQRSIVTTAGTPARRPTMPLDPQSAAPQRALAEAQLSEPMPLAPPPARPSATALPTPPRPSATSLVPPERPSVTGVAAPRAKTAHPTPASAAPVGPLHVSASAATVLAGTQSGPIAALPVSGSGPTQTGPRQIHTSIAPGGESVPPSGGRPLPLSAPPSGPVAMPPAADPQRTSQSIASMSSASYASIPPAPSGSHAAFATGPRAVPTLRRQIAWPLVAVISGALVAGVLLVWVVMRNASPSGEQEPRIAAAPVVAIDAAAAAPAVVIDAPAIAIAIDAAAPSIEFEPDAARPAPAVHSPDAAEKHAPPRPPHPAAPPQDPVEAAFAAEHFSEVVAACNEAQLAKRPAICTLSACRAHVDGKARDWLARVPPAQVASIVSACKAVHVDPTVDCAKNPLGCQR